MRVGRAVVHELTIPFVESFRHARKERSHSDSVLFVVELACGVRGYGEGVPRPYVTGETPELMVEEIIESLWPRVRSRDWHIAELQDLLDISKYLGVSDEARKRASVAAVELALLDGVLKTQDVGLSTLLPPKAQQVRYSGVITAGEPKKVEQIARQYKLFDIPDVKVKVGFKDDHARLRCVRGILGGDKSIRIDANGAWTVAEAIANINRLADIGLDAVEAPIAPGSVSDLAEVKRGIDVPVCVDEFLVSRRDAFDLIEQDACDIFNLRVSKCGGIGELLRFAELANAHDLCYQIGCQVGETAILSAAGRHVAAHLSDFVFLEGSFGSFLLTEDLSEPDVNFGHRGVGALFTGPGLGINILEERIEKYSVRKHVLQN
ncbi:mandelate racemase/muconate lactonizing enzyme family protein [Planctomycetota bacterium]